MDKHWDTSCALPSFFRITSLPLCFQMMVGGSELTTSHTITASSPSLNSWGVGAFLNISFSENNGRRKSLQLSQHTSSCAPDSSLRKAKKPQRTCSLEILRGGWRCAWLNALHCNTGTPFSSPASQAYQWAKSILYLAHQFVCTAETKCEPGTAQLPSRKGRSCYHGSAGQHADGLL